MSRLLTADLPHLLDTARAWLDDDPDPGTRAELAALLTRAEAGDVAVVDDLQDRFCRLLQFGTAGLRGALGAGPNRMNRAVVVRAAAGLVAYLQTERGIPDPMVVVGYDARHQSDVFARDTCAVFVGAGGQAAVLPHPLPTPVLAYAIRHLGADAGVMVTASHNPAQDNGYKVYLDDGSQIVPPADGQIATHIAAVARVADVPRADDGWLTLGDDVHEDYLDAVCAILTPGGPRDLTVVHTALHGVGSQTVSRAFARAGFGAPQTVSSQAEPDPDFPTVAFPNPEEPGAIDEALTLAWDVRPDLVVANDPDADRCAVAVLDGEDWRMLRGDEVGALLGAYVLQRGVPDGGVLACSIVSSRLLAAMAADAGVAHEQTLTGFKWIARVPELVFGYEEALGYCVAPDVVRDKDGVSATLLLAEQAAALKAQGRTVLDVLDDLAVAHGVHATDSFSVRVDDLALITVVMERLREHPPRELGGVPVVVTDDLSAGDGGLPPTEGLRYFLADRSRVVVRPSGTEPKLKVYLEVVVDVTVRDDDRAGSLATARYAAHDRLEAIREDLADLTSP